MTAMMATSNPFDSHWYAYFGASNHVTSDLTHLSNKDDYHGNEQLYLANGTCIPIKRIGHASVQLSSSSKSLYLHQLLHVPAASKNLLSVSKFASDNNVFF